MTDRRPLWRQLDLTTGDGRTYLRRRGVQTRWFNIYLHHIEAPDPGRALHNHPWWFASLVLRGGYEEQVRVGKSQWVRRRRRWSLHRMSLPTWHRIIYAEPKTVTLIVTGRYRRTWGFLTEDGFVPHNLYRHAGLITEDNDR